MQGYNSQQQNFQNTNQNTQQYQQQQQSNPFWNSQYSQNNNQGSQKVPQQNQQAQRAYQQSFQGTQQAKNGQQQQQKPFLEELQQFLAEDNLQNVDLSQYNYLYQEKESLKGFLKEYQEPNETQARKQLLESKMQTKYKRINEIIKDQNAKSKQNQDKPVHQQEQKKEQLAIVQDQIRSEISFWANSNRGNIVQQLLQLDRVLNNFMPNSKWSKPTSEELQSAGSVKKYYLKATLIVHPDKVQQRNGSPRELAAANIIFDLLKESWEKYQQ